MEDKESGSLSQKSALDILLELHQGSVTGSLKLERPPLQKAVYFRDGQILFAASNDPKDQLASILVEEGKLGPEQMEVAQARATPGNPLAKVLTELGYISQRELAEAARIKVEKILTDLYTWNEGTYQFATKSLPKGGLDLALSTSRLLFASIRRLQDREWVLSRLGSLEAVLRPSPTFDQFLAEAEPEAAANDTLRLADGVKTVKQIGALSSLGEFDVCKVLAAALVAGGLQDAASPAVVASSDAFSFPSDAPAFEPPSFEPAPPSFEPPVIEPPPPPAPASSSSGSSIFGNETVGLETGPPRASSDTVFQPPPPQEPAEESEKTIFDDMPSPSATRAGSSRVPSFGQPTSASQLLVDEPEPESDFPTRTPPKPKGMRRGGGGGSGGIGGALKWIAVFVLAAGAGFALYTFGWPMLANGGGGGGGDAGGGDPQTGVTTTAPPTEGGATDPGTRIIGGGRPAETPTTTPATAGTDPRATGTAAGTTTPPVTATATSSAPPAPRPAPATTTAPTPAATTSTPSPRPAPAPAGGGGSGSSLLAGGKVAEAAQAFQRELASAQDQFTIAVGLYCNSDNVLRIASGINDRSLYVLPTSIDGKRCYRVIWGLYPSRDAASNGMRSLPSGISAGDAAVVDLSRLLR